MVPIIALLYTLQTPSEDAGWTLGIVVIGCDGVVDPGAFLTVKTRVQGMHGRILIDCHGRLGNEV